MAEGRDAVDRSGGRVMRVLRALLGGVLGLSAVLSGCSDSPGPILVAPYGVQPPPGDPTLEITDFSYTPSSPIPTGETLEFLITTNQEPEAKWVYGHPLVNIGDAGRPVPGVEGGTLEILLEYFGGMGNHDAGRIVYRGEITWLPEFGTAERLPVIARFDWHDDTPDVITIGNPLTVVNQEEN